MDEENYCKEKIYCKELLISALSRNSRVRVASDLTGDCRLEFESRQQTRLSRFGEITLICAAQIKIESKELFSMLKRSAITLVLALFAIGTCAFAQENQNQPSGQDNQGQPHERKGGGWGPRDPAQMVQRLTQDLNLTSDQQPKILTTLQHHQKNMQTLPNTTPLSH